MKTIFAKIFLAGTGIALVALLLVPHAFAQNYVVSPSYVATSSLSSQQANTVCASLPNATASQIPFCAWGGIGSPVNTNVPVTISQDAVLISVTSATSAVITWYTAQPTTTALWYSDDPNNQNAAVMSTNGTTGLSNTHSMTVSGINLMYRHIFKVGGYDAMGQMVSSGFMYI